MKGNQPTQLPRPVCADPDAFWMPPLLAAPPARSTPGIKLSAHNQETERWRLDRLQAVANQCADKGLPISQLHDHKGSLYVNWTCVPFTEQLVGVVRFWSGQAEYQSLHYVNGKLFLADHESYNPFEASR
jgi:hypothetical protein